MVTQSVSAPTARLDLSSHQPIARDLDSERLVIAGDLLGGNYAYTHGATGYRFPASFPNYLLHEVKYTDDDGLEVVVVYNAVSHPASLTFSIYPAPIYALGPAMIHDVMGYPKPRDVLNDSHPEILSTDAFQDHYEEAVFLLLDGSSGMELVDAGILHEALPGQNGPTGVQAILHDHGDVPEWHEVLLFESLGYYILVRLSASGPNHDLTWNQEFPSIEISDIHRANIDRIRREANEGNPDALYTMAYIEREGWGTPADRQAGLAWLERAAETGDLQSMLVLAEEYLSTDHDRVRYWMNRVIEIGTPEAVCEAAIFLIRNAVNDEPRAGAVETLVSIAEGGYIPAMRELAIMYSLGVIVEANEDNARTWLESASAHGDSAATEMLKELDNE